MEDFGGFKEWVNGGDAPDPEQAERLVELYPWFTTARIALRQSHPSRADRLLEMHLASAPLPTPWLHSIARGEYFDRSQRQIIDSFLRKPEYKIVPREGTTDDDIANAGSAQPDVVTEQLASIYRSQGLWQQAAEAYRKLSLVYPEKSVYFAEILADIESRVNNDNNN